MNVIFLTLAGITDVEVRGIYQDLMRKFRDEGHKVFIVTAAERRLGQETSLVDSHGVKILNVKTLDVQKTNIVEKGIGTLLIERQFKAAIRRPTLPGNYAEYLIREYFLGEEIQYKDNWKDHLLMLRYDDAVYV